MEYLKQEIFTAINWIEVHDFGANVHSGRFDKHKWYPHESERCEYCDSIRSPSNTYPFSLLTHCKSLKHVCSRDHVEQSRVKKITQFFKKKLFLNKKPHEQVYTVYELKQALVQSPHDSYTEERLLQLYLKSQLLK